MVILSSKQLVKSEKAYKFIIVLSENFNKKESVHKINSDTF